MQAAHQNTGEVAGNPFMVIPTANQSAAIFTQPTTASSEMSSRGNGPTEVQSAFPGVFPGVPVTGNLVNQQSGTDSGRGKHPVAVSGAS